KIGAGQYEDFDVAFGQLPDDSDQLTFKTLQTYSDGKVARWIEEPAGGDEPENPAPVLKLTAGGEKTTSAASESSSGGTSKAVDVLVRAALPGAGRAAEADRGVGNDAEALVGGHFRTLVPGQRAHQVSGQRLDSAHQGVAHLLGAAAVGQVQKHHVAGGAFDE